jgi:CRP/FNR family transcriptional regulator, cyclic AMP receptor protein
MSLTESERLAALRRVPFFARLIDADLQQVDRYAYLQDFDAGQQIFHQGDPGDCLYIIVSGHVRIYLGSPGGKLVTIRIYSPGDVFGEFAVLDGEPRSAHAIAMMPVVALAIDRDQFQTLRESYPAISDGVIAALVERLRVTTTFGQNMAFLGAVGKIATSLAQLGRSLGDGKMPVRLKYSQSEIGLMAGVTREWVNKAYKELFVPNELIKLDQKRDEVIILDLERLAQWEDLPDGPRRIDVDGACAYARQRLETLPRSLSYH